MHSFWWDEKNLEFWSQTAPVLLTEVEDHFLSPSQVKTLAESKLKKKGLASCGSSGRVLA
jgi:hypothetical protein